MVFAVSMVILFQKLHCAVTNKSTQFYLLRSSVQFSEHSDTYRRSYILCVTCNSLCNVFVQKQLNRLQARRGQTGTFHHLAPEFYI